ncbi:hypothetical protein TIFTF001_034748 [Ficus carica]|uniref:Uncharacterized protein n=1 Tax=Ficus carica TaxID=3494 RepID=A0AA88J908_FICCA|nr:hypothetical protein TIFTF001_034748 [Ficus carica]
MARVNNLSATVDARWKGEAWRTVKCGDQAATRFELLRGNLQLYSEKKQHNAGHSKRGKQPSAMVDTRWKGMAGQTAKCGKSSCYAFCSL